MKRVKKITALLEKLAPYIAGGLATCSHYLWASNWIPKEINDLLSNTINLSGIAVGFLATGQGLLCSLSDNFVVKLLKQVGRFDEMLRFFTEAIFLCLLLAFTSLFGYSVEITPFLTANPFVFSLWLGLFIAVAVATIRVLIFLAMILHR